MWRQMLGVSWHVKPLTLEVTPLGRSPSLLLSSETRLRQIICLLLPGLLCGV